MTAILSLITKHKKIASTLGILIALTTLVSALYAGYNNLKNSWYERGVKDTELVYKQALIDAREQYDVELKASLELYKQQLTADFDEELARVKAEQVIDNKVSKEIEYVYKEIAIPAECNTVPTKFGKLFNEAIHTINSNITSNKQSRVDTFRSQLFTY